MCTVFVDGTLQLVHLPLFQSLDPSLLKILDARLFVNKCNGSCNNINDPYATLCVHDIVKGMNIKVFNLISRIN